MVDGIPAKTAGARGDGRLRRFVACSILAHLGFGIAWGVPALIRRMGEQERVQEEQALAQHFRKEEAKTREHVRQQRVEQTRRDVERELRKEFDKLTDKLSERKREELWKESAERTRAESTNFAEALGNPETPEQDLRTLEAELRRKMIESLDRQLDADTAHDLADRFLGQVEGQVVPGLAKSMKDELEKRVAQKMREEAERLIAKQREESQRARAQALGALKEAAARADAAQAAAKQAGEQLARTADSAKRGGMQSATGDAAARQAGDKAKAESVAQAAAAARQLDQAGARLGEADARVGQAAPTAAALDGKAQGEVAAADQAIAAAREVTARASAAVKAGSADAAAAVAAAQAATAAAQAATTSAIDAVGGQADRAVVAAAGIRAAAESALGAQVEQALTDELTRTTLPRLAGKLEAAFKKQLEANGMSDDALVAQVGKEVRERLAKSVPAIAKAGNAAVDAKLADVGGQAAAGSAAPGAAAKPSLLDKALAEGLAGMGANAVKRVGDLAANGSQDGALVDKAVKATAGAEAAGSAAGEDDAAAISQLRDSVGAMARSMGSGRIGARSGPNVSIGDLRQLALGRSGHGSVTRDEQAYQAVSDRIAGREAVQGGRWAQRGAGGETSQALDAAGAVPATVVGEAIGAARSSLSNDQPYAPTFKSLAFATVPYFAGAFRIDGDLAKWEAIPAIELKPEHGSFAARQVMKLAWSNAGLFFYCRIADPNHHLDKADLVDFWEADVAEIWIDAYNTKEKFRARHVGQQFWIWPAGSKSDPTLTGGESLTLVKGGGYKPVGLHADQLERWATQTDEGWVMEARIPPALITDADLAAGRILGFNAYITTMGGTDWFWSAGDTVGTSSQPDTWGDLLLAGADARIEVLSGHEDAAKRVLAVGEPLRLQVTDGDMDLDPTARDKVMVTLKDGRGGQQIAVLEETGPSTGVFAGAVSTALALDEPVPAVLGVYEGERVDIVYVDQARANGAREAQVATTVRFGSAVMAMGAPPRPPAP